MSQDDKDIDKNAADSEAEESAESTEAADAEETEASAEDAESNPETDGDDGSDDGDDGDDGSGDGDDGSDDGDDGSDDGDEPGEPGEHDVLYGFLAEFRSPGDLIAAAEKVRDAGFSKWDCYSPFPVHGIDPAMGIKRTILPVIVFIIGLCGLGGGLLLQWWGSDFNWPWIVSGKPFFSIPANIPIAFETTILASVFASFFGMWGLNKLPQAWHPMFKQDRFLKATDDSFFIGLEAADDKFNDEETEELLRKAGALAVERVYVDNHPHRLKLPRAVVAFIMVTAVLGLIPFALAAKARAERSPNPHVHIIPDMDFQPKAKAQTASDMFWDGRATRVDVEGVVARGELKADDHFYRGLQNGEWAGDFPTLGTPSVAIDRATLERGKDRYDIYCLPCHGADGAGQGIIHQRAMTVPQVGWVQPYDLRKADVVRQPHGQIYNTISNGIRTMKGYDSQITEADRWAVVLYVRALQRSQNASADDVPPENRTQVQ